MTSLTSIQRAAVRGISAIVCAMVLGAPAAAQRATDVVRMDLPTGRSIPLAIPAGVVRVSVTNPEIADALVASPTDVVLNAKASGETDVLLWLNGGGIRHYRIQVRSPADRMQILVAVKFAEVRRDFLQKLGMSALYRGGNWRIGGGQFRNDAAISPVTGEAVLPLETSFLTLLTDAGTSDFLGMIDLEARRGNARILAEPNIIAGNREVATFLAGGEVPIPIAQPGAVGTLPTVTIQYREFGVKLNFEGEIISDSLVRLRVRPEVSSLDYTNGVVLSGFRIPALRTRRVESTLDVRREQSLILSGLFNDERERVRTGVPYLMDIPVLGHLFSSTSWQRNETELLVIVTPVVIDPMRPPQAQRIELVPDTRTPAEEAIAPRRPVGPPQP